MTIDHVFTAVFVIQLLVVSLYVPGKILRRARALIATRPPAEYPKLYPVPLATIERVLRVWGGLNSVLLVTGLALLAAAWVLGYTIDPAWQFGDIPAKNPIRVYWVYTCLQGAPIMLWGLWELRYFKRMRATARDSIRVAQLKPRRLSDFVSPTLLGTAAATYVAAAVLLLFLGWEARPRIQFSAQSMFSGMTLCNLFMAGMLAWMLRGKKLDPHQTHGDRARAIRAGGRIVVVGTILLNAFTGIMSLLIAFRLLHYAPILASLFFQVSTILSTKKFGVVAPFGQEDFDVYRANTTRAGA
jgi:hypothetical protein